MTWHADVAVIGAGAAGCVAAAAAAGARRGARVIVVDGGSGATALSSGAVDVASADLAAADPLDPGLPIAAAAEALALRVPRHPYARVGACGRDQLGAALELLRALASDVELIGGAVDAPGLVVATSLGTARPVALAQQTLAVGRLDRLAGMRVGVGHFGRIGHFDGRATVATMRLAASMAAPVRRFEPFPLEVKYLRRGRDARSGVFELARRFDEEPMIDGLARAVVATLRAGSRLQHLLLPPLIGLAHPRASLQRLSQALGLPVSELAALPPSIPGWRLAQALLRGLASHGVEVIRGRAIAAAAADGALHHIEVLEAGAQIARTLHARRIVLATGHLIGGGLRGDGELREPLLGLPVTLDDGAAATGTGWLAGDYLQAQPALRAGVAVDEVLRPLDPRSQRPLYGNLHLAGALIAGNDPALHKAGLGLCALTGYLAGRAAMAD